MYAIGNDELAKLKPLKPGQRITCPTCGKRHRVYGALRVMPDGAKEETNIMMFYRCDSVSYIAGVGGKNVVGM